MPLIKNDESRPTGKKFLLPSLIRPEFDIWNYMVRTNFCKLIFKCPYKIHSYADVHIQTQNIGTNKINKFYRQIFTMAPLLY